MRLGRALGASLPANWHLPTTKPRTTLSRIGRLHCGHFSLNATGGNYNGGVLFRQPLLSSILTRRASEGGGKMPRVARGNPR